MTSGTAHKEQDDLRGAALHVIAVSPAALPLLDRGEITLRHLYLAAVRLVMRRVVTVMARARGLDAGLRRAPPSSHLRSPDALSKAIASLGGGQSALGELPWAADLAPDHVGVLYEGLLDLDLLRSPGGGFALERRADARKRTGTFYTRHDFAGALVRRALHPLTHHASGRARPSADVLALTVCDPAMGSGSFLLAALAHVTNALGKRGHGAAQRRVVAERCLYGADADPIAAELARAALWLAVADPSMPERALDDNLVCGDALTGARPGVGPRARDAASLDDYCARFFGPGGERRLLHWEIAFPHVFEGGGFGAIVGNPPWEIQKPSSKEFFARLDPKFRAYGKQEALAVQRRLLDERAAEQGWAGERAAQKALSRWVHQTTSHQGSGDLNAYKLFLEVSHALLRPGGRLGVLVPAGLYADHGSRALRSLFLHQCTWDLLMGFENKASIFPIHRSFKLCAVTLSKGGSTRAIRAAFLRTDPRDLDDPDRVTTELSVEDLVRMSPRSGSFVEVRSAREAAIVEGLCARAVPLGDQGPLGFSVDYARELDMTNDSSRFAPLPSWEERGYRPSVYGLWLKGPWRRGRAPLDAAEGTDGASWIRPRDVEGVAAPVYEGRMIGQLDPSAKGWVSGKGRTAVWRSLPWSPWSDKRVAPQFLIGGGEITRAMLAPKVAFMDVTASTNARTMIATVLRAPCGNSAPVLYAPHDLPALAACLNSFVYDFIARLRTSGVHLNWFIVGDTVLPPRSPLLQRLSAIAARLALPSVAFAPLWQRHDHPDRAWRSLWAVTPHERLRLRAALDAAIASLYGLRYDDLAFVLRDCDHPSASVRDRAFARRLDPKGFWRIDKERPPELRHTVLTLIAFRAVEQMGLAAFLAQNEGDGWMLPASVRLRDYGLGRDARAAEPSPVAPALGPRWLSWQREEPVEPSWQDRQRHAELLSQIEERAGIRA